MHSLEKSNKVFKYYDPTLRATAIIDLTPVGPKMFNIRGNLKNSWYINTYFINPLLWGSHIQDALMREMIQWIRNEKVNIITPAKPHFNDDDNDKILNYLMKWGFDYLNDDFLIFKV